MVDAARVGAGQSLLPRLRLMRILAWVMVAVTAVGLFGIVDLMTLPGWVDQRYIWAVSLEASLGSLKLRRGWLVSQHRLESAAAVAGAALLAV